MKATIRQGLMTLLMLLAVALSFSVQAERKLLDQVVAIVDDDVVLQTELEARINTITGRLSAQGTGLPSRRLLEERVLDQLITEIGFTYRLGTTGDAPSAIRADETLATWPAQG